MISLELLKYQKFFLAYDYKRRKLKTGEYYDADTGRYRFKYKDADGKWQAVYSWTLTHNDAIPAGKRQKSGESLREKEAQILKAQMEGMNISKGNMTVNELLKLYVDVKSKDVKETTKAGYRTQLKFMSTEAFGKRKIAEINETEAVLWFNSLHEKQGKNYSTLHTLRGMLRPAFTMAKKNGWVRTNPFDFPMLKRRYGGTKTREALTRNDMRRFLDFVKNDKHYSRYFYGMFILFNTGLRISEFCGLTIEDIDFNRGLINVNKQLLRHNTEDRGNLCYVEDTTKTEAGARYVPMSNDVKTCFWAVLDARGVLENEPVIYTLDGKTAYTGFIWLDKEGNPEVAQHWENHFRWARDAFNRIYKDELPSVTPHVARHTYCSNMASAGMNPKTLQQIMGHASVSVTMDIYTHLEKDAVMADFNDVMNRDRFNMYSLEG